jgi:phosphatidylserine decarboxylase
VIGKMSHIPGEYYTVNPIAVRSSLDVYAENARTIVPIDSPAFGRVYNVCIGAMMVGSIQFTKKEGDHIARGEEYGELYHRAHNSYMLTYSMSFQDISPSEVAP